MSKKRKKKAAQTKAPPARPKRQPVGALWPVLAAVIVVLAVAAVYSARRHAATSDLASPQPASSSFAGDHYPSQGHQGHMPGDAQRYANFRYNSDPPTSGYHLEVLSNSFVNAQPLPKYLQVHLLEHGNILLQYNCICPGVAQQLKQIADEFDHRLLPAGTTQPTFQDVKNAEEQGLAVVVAPYPSMPHTIALTAWTRLATLPAVDQAKIVSFINQWLHNSDNLNQ